MSADALIFNSVFPVWTVALVAIALLAFFLYGEVKRIHRFLIVRIAAQILIIASLAALVLRPSIRSEKNVGSALILTKGYEKKAADSLLNTYPLQVLRTFDAAPYPKSRLISSWHSLTRNKSDIRFVIGEGIPSFALEENLNFDFLPTKLPIGITRLNIEPLKAYQRNSIKGIIHTENDNAILKLLGPGGDEDSVQLKNKGSNPFTLTIKAGQPGKFIYQITLREETSTKTENLPVEVEEEKKLNILFVQPFPTFETRYLKNYLGEKGHAITLRYQVSKNVYRYEYANREKQSVPSLTATLLNSFDLLVITPAALQTLSSSEIRALDLSIKSGLGMLVLIDQKPVKNNLSVFPLQPVPAAHDTVTLSLPFEKEKITLPATPLRVNASPAIQSLFVDSDKKILSGYFYHGSGKTGFQFLNETYRLALEGRKNEYADIWSPLIGHTARSAESKFKVNINSSFPRYPDQPIDFEVISSLEPPKLYYDSTRIPLKEDVVVENIWHGTVWADHAGWHEFQFQDSSVFNFYVSAPKEWEALRIANQISQNKAYHSSHEIRQTSITEYHPLSPLLFFILFLLASGTLWLAAKL
jgi:hypothetical protein